MPGLVLVVGPSGAGKDTLIAAAADSLANNRNVVFPKRLITRDAQPDAEDHGSLSREAFEQLRSDGDALLCWEAHGLGYVLPSSIREDFAAGRTAICNGSRAIVAEAVARYPATQVVMVTASPAVRAERLAKRGRETREEIIRRLERETAPLPAGIEAIEIDNSGELQPAIDTFVATLQRIAG